MTPSARYLHELAARLPFALGLRRRVLAEVREHLADGGEDGRRRFGDVDELARQLRRELALSAVVRASWLVPLLVAAFVIPFYVIPESTLPAAPWTDKPAYLAWKQSVAGYALAVAAASAVVAFAAARLRPRLAVVPLAAAAAALAVSATLGGIVAVQWIDAAPGTSAPITYATLALAVALAAAVAEVVREVVVLRNGRHELAPD